MHHHYYIHGMLTFEVEKNYWDISIYKTVIYFSISSIVQIDRLLKS